MIFVIPPRFFCQFLSFAICVFLIFLSISLDSPVPQRVNLLSGRFAFFFYWKPTRSPPNGFFFTLTFFWISSNKFSCLTPTHFFFEKYRPLWWVGLPLVGGGLFYLSQMLRLLSVLSQSSFPSWDVSHKQHRSYNIHQLSTIPEVCSLFFCSSCFPLRSYPTHWLRSTRKTDSQVRK